MEEMNKDTLMNTDKLCQIYKAITAGQLPRDDTMIEKLEGALKHSISCDESLIEKSNFVDSLSLLLEQDSPNPQAVAFYLKTVSYIPNAPEDNVSSLSWDLYEKVPNCDLWGSAAVRCAWLKGLRNLASSSESTTAVIDWIVQYCHASRLWGALTDRSLFVSKAAVELASVLILVCSDTAPTSQQSPESSGQPPPPSQQLSQMFWNLFNKCLTERTSLRFALLLVLEEVVGKQSSTVLENTCREHGVLAGIHSLFGPSKAGVDDAERRLCLQILDHCESVVATEDVGQYEESAISLIDGGDVKTAMALSCWLLTCHEAILRDKAALEDVAFAVISLGTSPESRHLSAIREHVQARTLSALSLILAQLEIMRTYHDKLDISLSYLHAIMDSLWGVESQLSTLLLNKIKGKEVTMKQSLLDTLNHVFQTRPAARNKALMIRFIMSSSSLVNDALPVSLIQKVLKTLLTSLVYLTCSVDFDKEEDAFVQTTSHKGCGVDDVTKTDTDESPGAMVDEVVTAWSNAVGVINRLLTDTRWEVTDSAVELLTQILIQVRGASFIWKAFYLDSGLGEQILILIDHSESYLRASAMKCVGSMAAVPEIWEHIIESHSKDALLGKVIEIGKDDSEAFARRGAVDLLGVFFWLDCYRESQSVISETMCQAINDLDWEVKQIVLNFWTHYISDLENNSSKGVDIHSSSKRTSAQNDTETDMFVSGISSECLTALLKGAVDCDKTVQQKACAMLKPIKAKLSNYPLCKKPRPSEKLSNNSEQKNNPCSAGKCRSDLLEELVDMDLDSLIHMSSLSTDQYDLHPEALLDDILVSVGHPCQAVPAEDGCEDNAIDCY